MNNGNMTGYNSQNIAALRDVIDRTAQSVAEKVVTRLHDEIIRPIANAWYAPEAIEFFTKFAETVKNTGVNIREIFDSFRQAVEKAGSIWAENTGGEAPVLGSISDVNLNLSVSEIQAKDSAGNVYIDEAAANNVANNLANVEEEIKSDMQAVASDLDASTAFLGQGQSEAVAECFVKINLEIHLIFKFLTEGDLSLQAQITSAVNKYKEVSVGIKTGFQQSE